MALVCLSGDRTNQTRLAITPLAHAFATRRRSSAAAVTVTAWSPAPSPRPAPAAGHDGSKTVMTQRSSPAEGRAIPSIMHCAAIPEDGWELNLRALPKGFYCATTNIAWSE